MLKYIERQSNRRKAHARTNTSANFLLRGSAHAYGQADLGIWIRTTAVICFKVRNGWDFAVHVAFSILTLR